MAHILVGMPPSPSHPWRRGPPRRDAASASALGPGSHVAAYWGGRLVAVFARRAVDPRRVLVDGPDNVPPGPVVWATWHGNNMLALTSHGYLNRGGYAAFVPPGVAGAAMRGCLDGSGCEEGVTLPPDGTGNVSPGLKCMVRSLRGGRDAVVAVDGPRGPALRVRPGALWLARLARAPVVAVGFGARPALRIPRWDRHVVPVPGSRIVVSIAAPIRPAPGDEMDGLVLELEAALRQATERARRLLQGEVSEAGLKSMAAMAALSDVPATGGGLAAPRRRR